MNQDEKLFQGAVESFRKGEFQDAERLFKTILEREPKHVGALNLLTVVLMSMQRNEEAEKFARAAIAVTQGSDVTFYNYGLILRALKRPRDALVQFDRALSINRSVAETWNNRGATFNDLREHEKAISDFDKSISLNSDYPEPRLNKGRALARLMRFQEACAAFDEALALKPDLAEAWLGRGNVLFELRRPDEAFAALDKALALKPNLAEAWLGRGNVLFELRRPDEAFAAFDKALALKPDLAEAWLGRGNTLSELRRPDEAFIAFDKALALRPDLAEAWLGRGNTLSELKRPDEAFVAFDEALALRPDLAEAWAGRGALLAQLKRHDEAFAHFDKALALKPDWAEMWFTCGNLYTDLNLYEKALAAYDKALGIRPDIPGLRGMHLNAKMRQCDWTNIHAESEQVILSIRSGNAAIPPFNFLSISSSPADQLQCARLWVAEKFPPKGIITPKHERYQHDRIRVAYMSDEIRHHAIGFLTAGMFECHDRSRFDITAISYGPNDDSEVSIRLKSAIEHFVDARNQSDDEIAALVKSSEIDLLVDLKGHIQGGRPDILARRVAPLQINYLGYTGTMGAAYVDYIVADKVVIADNQKAFYSEKICFLPYSYQSNDNKRQISERAYKRTEVGLPENGFVFCCFNNNFKILPDVFDCWMRILTQLDDSVLWLLEDNKEAAINLKNEAARRGIDPARLIFAARLPVAEHLSRHRCADLFLDTLPYNAHTTASDALWAGLPVLTQIGETFPGRVAASLLTAVGLAELITSTPQAYEDLAIELATNRERLAAIKHKLATNRLRTPLFDTQQYTRHIEAAYTAMYGRYQLGLSPDHIHVPP